MTAKTDLPPLPEPNGSYTNPYDGDDLEAYAHARVAHAIAPLQAEIDTLRTRLEDTVRDSTNKIEALRAEVTEWKRVAAAQAELHGEAEARANKMEAEVERLQEIVRPKREDECLTLDHWRMRAYALEENWSRCSRACAVEQTKREQAEARAKRLAEELREAKEKMLAHVKWVACDCGCEGEKPADAVSIAWFRASTLLSDQENTNDR
jgi:chromosome segregation ATPase